MFINYSFMKMWCLVDTEDSGSHVWHVSLQKEAKRALYFNLVCVATVKKKHMQYRFSLNFARIIVFYKRR